MTHPRRVMVIGPCGAGKSHAGRRIAERMQLPLVHMDQLGWKAGWVERSPEELHQLVEAAAAEERWLIEGNYGSTMHLRLPRAELVVYLDYPISFCLARILRRWWQSRGRTRPDMAEGCEERLDPAFLWYVLRWNSGPGPRTEAKLAGHEDKVVRLASPQELEDWIEAIAPRIST